MACSGPIKELSPFGESWLNGLLRKITWRILKKREPKSYYRVTSFLKRTRKLLLKSSYGSIKVSPAKELDIQENLSNQGNSLNVLISHDIDSALCQANLTRMLEIERNLDFVSTIHFLYGAGYVLDWANVEFANEIGNEIGLHGRDHDIAFGYRKVSEIEKVLLTGKKFFDAYNIKAFRAPGFGMTLKAIDVLIASGFSVDSSSTSGLAFNKPIAKPFLIRNREKEIVEISVNFSDDRMIRDLKHSYSQQIEILCHVAWECSINDSPLLVNIHPGLHPDLKSYEKFVMGVRNMLDRNFQKIAFQTITEAADMVRNIQGK